LMRASTPARPTIELHLPPPIHVVADTTLTRMRNSGGEKGLWQFSPVAYSRNGTDAMFYYMYTCGSLCGNASLVWASKDSDGEWHHRRTAQLVIF
jgi:hypothetical protein